MPVAAKPQHMQALARACEIKNGRAQKLSELHGASPSVIRAAIVSPTPELASYKLCVLFARKQGALIHRFGLYALHRAFRDIEARYPRGRRWHGELRLDELTKGERERLAQAVIQAAPQKWREAA